MTVNQKHSRSTQSQQLQPHVLDPLPFCARQMRKTQNEWGIIIQTNLNAFSFSNGLTGTTNQIWLIH